MSNVLVIGASGFLGNTLIDYFQNLPSVKTGALSRSPIHFYSNNVQDLCIDVLDYDALDVAIKKYDVIINCSGQISTPISKCLTLNTKGIENIVNAVKKYNKKLIHISTVSVYGSSLLVNEKSEVNPETVYGSIKYFAEHLIFSSLDDYLILRVSNLFGRLQKRGIINYLESSYKENDKKIFFNNDGSMKRYYLNVEDLAEVITQIYNKKICGIYNIVGNDCFTIKDIVKKFANLLHYEFDVLYDSIKPKDNIDKIDATKFKSLGISFHQSGLEDYIRNIKK